MLHSVKATPVRSLWIIRVQPRTELWDKGIMLDFPLSIKESVNNLPLVGHAKIWNNHTHDKVERRQNPPTTSPNLSKISD